jgi:hypothetical protein
LQDKSPVCVVQNYLQDEIKFDKKGRSEHLQTYIHQTLRKPPKAVQTENRKQHKTSPARSSFLPLHLQFCPGIEPGQNFVTGRSRVLFAFVVSVSTYAR